MAVVIREWPPVSDEIGQDTALQWPAGHSGPYGRPGAYRTGVGDYGPRAASTHGQRTSRGGQRGNG